MPLIPDLLGEDSSSSAAGSGSATGATASTALGPSSTSSSGLSRSAAPSPSTSAVPSPTSTSTPVVARPTTTTTPAAAPTTSRAVSATPTTTTDDVPVSTEIVDAGALSASLSSAAAASSSAAAAAAASAKAAANDDSLSTLTKSLLIAGIAVASTIALIVAIGFLLRRRSRSRHRSSPTSIDLDFVPPSSQGGLGGPRVKSTYEDDAASDYAGPGGGGGAHEKDFFSHALGKRERPSNNVGPGSGYGQPMSAGGMSMYGHTGSELSLAGPILQHSDNMYGHHPHVHRPASPYSVNGGGGGGGGGGYPSSPLGNGYPALPSASQDAFLQHNHLQMQQQRQARPITPSQAGGPRGPSGYGYDYDYADGGRPYSPAPPSSAGGYHPQQPQPHQAPPQQAYGYHSPPQQQPQPQQQQSPTRSPSDVGVAGGGPLDPGGAHDERGVLMWVVRSFPISMEDELAIEPNSELLLHQTFSDGWCMCSSLAPPHQRGFVPRNCLSSPPPPTSSPQSPHSFAGALGPSASLPQIPHQQFTAFDPLAAAAPVPAPAYTPSASSAFALGDEKSGERPASVLGELDPLKEFGLPARGVPRSMTTLSLAPSEMTVRRSSLLESARTAGRYLAQAPGQRVSQYQYQQQQHPGSPHR